MDLGAAQRVAMMASPNGLAGVAKNANDPAATRRAAQQFGALMMQELMRQSDGTALPMAGGTGSDTINAMFSSTMGQAAMAHDRTGLADLLLRSIQQKQHQAGETAAPATSTGAPAPAALPLAAYWQGNGLRPLAVAIAAAATPGRMPAIGPLLAAMPNLNPKMASLFGVHGAPPPVAGTTTFDASPGHASGGASAADIAGFVQKLAPLVEQAGRQLGVSPKILLAQAAIETGWGRSVVGNNLFGIKAGSSWSGPQVTTGTHEYQNGELVAIQDAFRAYPDAEASVKDFVALVANRYKAAVGSGDDVTGYAHRLLAGGWATDINYVGKLQAVAAHPAVAAAFGPTPPSPPVQPGQPTPLLPPDFAPVRR